MQTQYALEKYHAVTSLILHCGFADAAKKMSEAQEEPVKEPKTTVDEDLLRAFRYFDKTGTGSVVMIVTVMLWEILGCYNARCASGEHSRGGSIL